MGTIEEFTTDPNLLVSVIKSQAGTLTKALLEGVMNSIDAGATRVDITLDEKNFVISDNGQGFRSREEIRDWFGRFGTPHTAGDAVYGRFRMGRGQLFSHAVTVWTSNHFQMTVDLERLGLRYEVKEVQEPVRGCRIEGTLHKPLSISALTEILQELRKYVAFTPRPVYVNGTLYGADPARLKTWTHETDDAWIRVIPDSHELVIYNQGVYVCAMPTWRTGTAGIVVSKRPLEVNFARNDIMESDCQVWARIREQLRQAVFKKLARASKLTENERGFLARHIKVCDYEQLQQLREVKVLTEPSGRHVPLSALREARVLAYAPKATATVCQLHGGDVFVITDQLINRFGEFSFEGLIARLEQRPGILHPEFRTEDFAHLVVDRGVGDRVEVPVDALTPRQRAALEALEFLNETVGNRLALSGRTDEPRKLLIARQKKPTAMAWTDGRTFITFDVRQFREFEAGVDGVQRLVYTLLHEYMHDTDDSESHDHGEVFFQKFHDALFDKAFATGKLAQEGLLAYLAALKVHGVQRPRRLSKQLDTAMPR